MTMTERQYEIIRIAEWYLAKRQSGHTDAEAVDHIRWHAERESAMISEGIELGRDSWYAECHAIDYETAASPSKLRAARLAADARD